MTILAYAAPVAKQAFIDNSGNPLNGGKLFVYAAGTITKITTYQDAGLVSPNTNPIILDSVGRTPGGLFVPPGTFFKLTLAPSTDTDPPTSPYWTVDNLGNAVNGVPFSTDTGVANALLATVVGVPTVPTAGTSVVILTANGSTGACTINVTPAGGTAWGAISIRDRLGNAMGNGSFAANQEIFLTYDGTFWRTQFMASALIPYGADTGTVNAMVANPPGLPPTPATGVSFMISPANVPTSAVALNASGWGSILVYNAVNAPCQSASWTAGALFLIAYDGTHWRTPFAP